MDNSDEINNNLIKLLEQNAWQSSETLANVLNVGSVTVRRRLRRLIQKEGLRAVAIADSGTVALPLTTVIALDINHQNLVSVVKKRLLKKLVSYPLAKMKKPLLFGSLSETFWI